jgi:hypothetical protein
MSPKAVKHVLKPGIPGLFVGGRTGRIAMAWRLDVREDASGQAQLFRKRRRPGMERGRLKLFHYIAAGGLRQLRRTTADDIAESRRRSFLIFLGLMFAVWVVFYFLPSA